MLTIRPKLADYRLVLFYTGRIIQGVAFLMVVPLIVSLFYGEWPILVDFAISALLSWIIGIVFERLGSRQRQPGWIHGMVSAAFSWFLAMALSAVPYYLSGHYLSFLDAMFDVMSGFTTTGLTLIQDLDHVSMGVNMWRHLVTFVGGQGMVVLALTFLFKNTAGGFRMYVGEAKDERLLPSVLHTARVIWKISLVYLLLGTVSLWLAGMIIGLTPARAFWHGLWVFMAAWSTGGFAPMSQNILYYHSLLYETVTIVFFVIGSFNFALHYSVWTGNRREIYKNIEMVSFFVTLTLLTSMAVYGLSKVGAYTNIADLLRKGFYQMISGHTTTGFMTIYARQFIKEWGDIALWAISIAMLIGGSACSTAGGFKGLRVGIFLKAIVQDTRRLLAPENAIIVQRYHHIKDVVLEDKTVRAAALVIILYVITFLIGTMAGVFAGYPLADSAFESASVTGNVGLSCGVTSAAMPWFLKVVYILFMWVARLEFLSVLALGGFIIAGVKKG